MRSLVVSISMVLVLLSSIFASSFAEARFLQTDPIGTQDQMNLYNYVSNDPLNMTDPSGMCWFCIAGELHTMPDGSIRIESNEFLRLLVPGQISWDYARTNWANGNKLTAVANTGAMVGESAITVLSMGTSSAFSQTTRAGTTQFSTAAGAQFAKTNNSMVLESGQRIVGESNNITQSVTVFGQALTKHAKGQRASGTFPPLTGNPATINQKALDFATDILTNPASTDVRNGIVTVRNEAGQGLRYVEETKKFLNFAD